MNNDESPSPVRNARSGRALIDAAAPGGVDAARSRRSADVARGGRMRADDDDDDDDDDARKRARTTAASEAMKHHSSAAANDDDAPSTTTRPHGAATASASDASLRRPRAIAQTLGADETHGMRDLFESWGLPRAFVEGIPPALSCRLVPYATTTEEQRERAFEGTPFLAPPTHARGVFDAVRGDDGSGDANGEGKGGGDATATATATEKATATETETSPTTTNPTNHQTDGVAWATTSAWSAFPRPKVAMVGGWGAPGTHLLSERKMKMVDSFAEVVDGDEPLNLQMFHRDDTSVPALARSLAWPLPEFFSVEREAGDGDESGDDSSDEDEPSPSSSRGRHSASADGTPVAALPAQGALYKTGGVGVPLDQATRLSAANALTWWHLDDCAEFVFQVALPLDLDAEAERYAERGRRRRRGRSASGGAGEDETSTAEPPPSPPRVLLGPTGKPVVKLFVFARREDYEWISQDGVMNQTMKQSALDLFDTPDDFLPTPQELTPPFSDAPLGGAYAPGSRTAAGADGDAAATAAKLPVFWVAPLEAGGCPLLSPPNVIHLVMTLRDCVMVEERRLSLLCVDEVQYFQRRAARWCEPPVEYRFLREDLADAARCARHAVRPLLRALRLGARDDDDTDGVRWARARNALATLSSDRERYAMDERTRAKVTAALAAADAWAATGDAAATRAARRSREDPRAAAHDALLAAMTREGEKNAHDLRAASRRGGGGGGGGAGPFCAVAHERGRPRWGPARATREQAAADRKEMRRAVKEGTLAELLSRWRGGFRRPSH